MEWGSGLFLLVPKFLFWNTGATKFQLRIRKPQIDCLKRSFLYLATVVNSLRSSRVLRDVTAFSVSLGDLQCLIVMVKSVEILFVREMRVPALPCSNYESSMTNWE